MCFSTQRREFKFSAFTNMRRSLKRSVKVSNKGKTIAVTLGHQLLSCHSNSMFRQDTKVTCELEYKKVGCVQVKILILFHAAPCCFLVFSHQCEFLQITSYIRQLNFTCLRRWL